VTEVGWGRASFDSLKRDADVEQHRRNERCGKADCQHAATIAVL
jgi:hypothetical protein